MTPDQVHFGKADQVYAARQTVVDIAFHATPNRFVNKTPQPPEKPTTAWINPPNKKLACKA